MGVMGMMIQPVEVRRRSSMIVSRRKRKLAWSWERCFVRFPKFFARLLVVDSVSPSPPSSD